MAFESDFEDMMPHNVVRKAFSTLDGYGKPTYATAGSTYSALVQYDQKLVRAFDGTEKISTAQVIMACTGTINPDDKITLPDGTSPPILNISKLSDDEGQHHVEVYFGHIGSLARTGSAGY